MRDDCHLLNVDATGAALRHRRVWVARSIALSEVGSGTDLTSATRLLDWVQRDRPLVGRARLSGDPAACVPVGLALPPHTRLTFCIPVAKVVRIEVPFELSEAIDCLPDRMRPAAESLMFAARGHAIPLHVYGSVFWQLASGDSYLHEASDLDLLARPATAAQARDWLDVVRRIDASAGLRIDGEVELPCGSAVAWRELAVDSEQLLVKSNLGPALWPRERVWAAWPAGCMTP